MVGLIVHEWLARHGGSENVVDSMRRLYPDADVLCLWNEAPDVRTASETWIAKSPLRGRKALSVPFLPLTWKYAMRRDVAYDFILASSHLFAHQIRTRGLSSNAPKYSYVHTPARYIWNPELDQRGDHAAVRAISPLLQRADRKAARTSTSIAANSEFVRSRIQNAWHQDARVIYPPVDVTGIQNGLWRQDLSPYDEQILDALPEFFILGASRLIPYKRLDRVIRTGDAAGIPVVIAGSGPEEAALRVHAEAARVPVSFIAAPSNALLWSLYERAAAFVFPPVEDFGIMPVEAMAAGTAVICNASGGARESIKAGETGTTIEDWNDRRALSAAVEQVVAYEPERSRANAVLFSEEAFQEGILAWVQP